MRLAGILLCIALLWLGALLAVLTFPIRAVVARKSPRTKDVLRLMDHITGSAWFGSNWWESLSANSARVRRVVLVAALNVVEPNHCAEALKRELDVIDFFNRRQQK